MGKKKSGKKKPGKGRKGKGRSPSQAEVLPLTPEPRDSKRRRSIGSSVDQHQDVHPISRPPQHSRFPEDESGEIRWNDTAMSDEAKGVGGARRGKGSSPSPSPHPMKVSSAADASAPKSLKRYDPIAHDHFSRTKYLSPTTNMPEDLLPHDDDRLPKNLKKRWSKMPQQNHGLPEPMPRPQGCSASHQHPGPSEGPGYMTQNAPGLAQSKRKHQSHDLVEGGDVPASSAAADEGHRFQQPRRDDAITHHRHDPDGAALAPHHQLSSSRGLPMQKMAAHWRLLPRTSAQSAYAEALMGVCGELGPSILVATGPAGTGKTAFACQAAIDELYAGTIDKIVITRPTVAVAGEDLGFLPGDADSKMAPYMQPIADCLSQVWEAQDLDRLRASGVIEVVPLGFMRGRTFTRTMVIADEMQNSTPSQMKSTLSRLGERSKMIVTGDLWQSDLPGNPHIGRSGNGLEDLVSRLRDHGDDTGVLRHIALGNEDVQRSRAVVSVMKLYGHSSDIRQALPPPPPQEALPPPPPPETHQQIFF